MSFINEFHGTTFSVTLTSNEVKKIMKNGGYDFERDCIDEQDVQAILFNIFYDRLVNNE